MKNIAPEASTLGFLAGVFSATVRRIWKVRKSVRTLRRRAFEFLVRPESFIALGSRGALCVLDAS